MYFFFTGYPCVSILPCRVTVNITGISYQILQGIPFKFTDNPFKFYRVSLFFVQGISCSILFTGNAGIPENPVIFTVTLQGTNDTQGYPVNFTGKIFAVYLNTSETEV